MPHFAKLAKIGLILSLILMLTDCASDSSQDEQEVQLMAQKQRWYWMGSTSLQKHVRPEHPENYWLEVDDERVTLQADCNHGSAKASATHEGRLWIEKVTTARVACPKGSLENTFIKQLAESSRAEQHGSVLRIGLNQYGEAMYFSRTPGARFSSYRCQGGETMALIAQERKLSIWLGEDFRLIKAEGEQKLSLQEQNNTLLLDDGKEAIAEGCHKISPE